MLMQRLEKLLEVQSATMRALRDFESLKSDYLRFEPIEVSSKTNNLILFGDFVSF